MKLSGKVTNPQVLLHICQSLEKSQKIWMLSFNEKYIKISSQSPNIISPTHNAHATILIDSLFENYVIESKRENRIWLEISGEHLTRAVKSGSTSIELKIKLAKKDNLAILCLLITNQSRSGKPISLIQDVPVRVLNYEMALEASYDPPTTSPIPDLKIRMPQLESIRKVLDRMIKFDPLIRVCCNREGRFKLKSITKDLYVESEFEIIPTRLERGSVAPENRAFTESLVHCKEFSHIIGLSYIRPTAVECMVFKDYLVVKGYISSGDHAETRLVEITFKLPVKKE